MKIPRRHNAPKLVCIHHVIRQNYCHGVIFKDHCIYPMKAKWPIKIKSNLFKKNEKRKGLR